MNVAVGAEDHASQRRNMVDCQIRTFNVTDLDVISAFDTVPRHPFVAPAFAPVVYADRSLPAAATGKPMLAPLVLARLIETAEVQGGDRVLVAGGGGYSAAIIARLAGPVTLLEESPGSLPVLAGLLAQAGAQDIRVVAGPLDKGHEAGAPYDVILIEGLVGLRPEALLAQLADGGRLITIERVAGLGRAVVYTRSGDDVGRRIAFDASGPELAAFQPKPAFSF